MKKNEFNGSKTDITGKKMIKTFYVWFKFNIQVK